MLTITHAAHCIVYYTMQLYYDIQYIMLTITHAVPHWGTEGIIDLHSLHRHWTLPAKDKDKDKDTTKDKDKGNTFVT